MKEYYFANMIVENIEDNSRNKINKVLEVRLGVIFEFRFRQ